MVKKSNKQLSVVTFVVGDFVFAKLRGSQPWPSIVRESNPKKVLVDFICPEKTWYVDKDIRNYSFIYQNCNFFWYFVLYRAWISTANVQSFSDSLVNELRQKHPKNLKLLKAIDAMLISIEEMKKQIAEKMGEKNEAAFEKRCLRSTHKGTQNCKAVQAPVDDVGPAKELQQIQTRNKKTTKPNDEIGSELHTEKNHYSLRSARTVSAKRHRNFSLQASIDTENKNPPKKRACINKIRDEFKTVKSPIATRTRSKITNGK